MWFIILFAAVWFVVWAFFFRGNDSKVTKPVTKQPSQSTRQPSTTPPSTTTVPAPSQAPNTNGQTGNQATTPAPSTTTPVAGTPTDLANSGPGDVIAVFIGGSLVGGFAYRTYLRRKLA